MIATWSANQWFLSTDVYKKISEAKILNRLYGSSWPTHLEPCLVALIQNQTIASVARVCSKTGISDGPPRLGWLKIKPPERVLLVPVIVRIKTKRVCLQRRRQLRSDDNDKGHSALHGQSGVETSGHIQVVLRDRRRVLSVRRANVLHEIRIVDIRRIHGEKPITGQVAVSTRCTMRYGRHFSNSVGEKVIFWGGNGHRRGVASRNTYQSI